jgi:hypothetical protein
MLRLNRQELLEITWVMENIEDYNGRGMRNEQGLVEVVPAAQVQELARRLDVHTWTGLVGDRVQVRCWTVQEDGQLEESWEHQGGAVEVGGAAGSEGAAVHQGGAAETGQHEPGRLEAVGEDVWFTLLLQLPTEGGYLQGQSSSWSYR